MFSKNLSKNFNRYALKKFTSTYVGQRLLHFTVYEEYSNAIMNKLVIRGDITIRTFTRGDRMIFMTNYE